MTEKTKFQQSNMSQKNIPVYTSDFGEMVRKNDLFIDKSRLIKMILDTGFDSYLITCPPQFGKTLNLSMLDHFFNVNHQENSKGLFNNCEINEYSELCEKHQNKYPVVKLSFEDIAVEDIDSFENSLFQKTQIQLSNFEYLLKSDELIDIEKKKIEEYLSCKCDKTNLYSLLPFFITCLQQHHGKNVILLFDDYDAPINKVLLKTNNIEEYLSVLRIFLGVTKDNTQVEFSVINGVRDIPLTTSFSGLNNLHKTSLLDKEFSDCYGFTIDEVKQLLKKTGCGISIDEIALSYGGYRIGNQNDIFNPYSIMRFLTGKCQFEAYWMNTHDTKLLKRCFQDNFDRQQKNFISLLSMGTIKDIIINRKMHQRGECCDSIWSHLLFTGYLTIDSIILENCEFKCSLKIPNREIRTAFSSFYSRKFRESFSNESFYQGTMLALFYDLQKTHNIS